MTLKDAKALRDEIRGYGYHCIVPLGHGPDGYTPRISSRSFNTREEFRKYHAMRLRERRLAQREYERQLSRLRSRPRSPIEMMVDKACGLY